MPFRRASQLITQSETGDADEPEHTDTLPDAPTVADIAYLDRFWATLSANADKGKTDEPWIVTVSLDMSKWFISGLVKTRLMSVFGRILTAF
jgi:hypothetical protein